MGIEFGLAYIFHGLKIILYLVLSTGVASYNIWLELYSMGFKTFMEMKTNDNETIVNYGDVVFGLIMDMRLAPLMRLGVWDNANLGLGSMKYLVILLELLFFWS